MRALPINTMGSERTPADLTSASRPTSSDESRPVARVRAAGTGAQGQPRHLDNGNVPTAPDHTESETADVQDFVREILPILPLVGLRVFEIPAAVATPATPSSSVPTPIPLADAPTGSI